MFERI